VVFFSYAGPGMQVAKHEWKQSWANYLSSSRGWIVAQIDGRGSGGEGDRRRFEIWHHLGNVEVIDQVFYQFFSIVPGLLFLNMALFHVKS
jgi:dipeptidyl aminopeptidase/acylaminoacyl peptidase